jgi:hypothetical protein
MQKSEWFKTSTGGATKIWMEGDRYLVVGRYLDVVKNRVPPTQRPCLTIVCMLRDEQQQLLFVVVSSSCQCHTKYIRRFIDCELDWRKKLWRYYYYQQWQEEMWTTRFIIIGRWIDCQHKHNVPTRKLRLDNKLCKECKMYWLSSASSKTSSCCQWSTSIL